ncbi:MAG: domain S-box protein [Sphingobacteriales bacterium]|nr:domain S-box protein [Sphingobacteriales bacterium]
MFLGMTQVLRPTGIDVIGDVPWGTHFCHFYETEKDLLALLVPYFKAGLENNEYCIWVTSGHITVDEAIVALEKAVPDFGKYVQEGSIEILPHADWYLTDGIFELDNAIGSIVDRLRIALQKKFEGLRLNGDEAWLDRKEWKDFIAYEEALNPAIAGKRLIISCTYRLDKCDAADVLDIALVHECAIAKRKGRWEILEVPELKKTKAQIQLKNEQLEQNVAERTKDLIAANRTLATSQANVQTIFNTTDIAFLLLDSRLQIMAFNEMADHLSERSFGAKLKMGLIVSDLINTDQKGPSTISMLQAALSGKAIHYEATYPIPDGRPEYYSISINPVKDTKGHTIGLCWSAINITPSKLMEIERIRITDDLLKRNQDLEQFTSIVSHHVRGPLVSIIGLTQIMRRDKLSPDEKKEFELLLSQAAEKLDDVIHDLNHILSRREIIEKRESVSFSELLTDILAGFKQVIEQEQIQVIIDFSQADEIFSIKSYLYSIFYNLVSNSIKYRQPNKQLHIQIRSLKEENKIVISFQDNGRGIDLKAKGEEVFGLYRRFHFDVEGKGMGLYMVKSQVETLGGNISISSQPNEGTTFTIVLPAK